MTDQQNPPSKDRRDIGQVVFLSEKMAAARELSSCCVGTEAALESGSGIAEFLKRFTPDSN